MGRAAELSSLDCGNEEGEKAVNRSEVALPIDTSMLLDLYSTHEDD